MPTEEYLLSVIRGERRGATAEALRLALSLCSYLYRAGLALFLLPYRLGVRKQAALPCPVISIGNLTVGGTGKTPITQVVCEYLMGTGKKVCVLNRGYRGGNEHGVAVVSDGRRVLQNAREAGDEAFLLAGLLKGVPVVVGKDRRKSGKVAFDQFSPDVIVLDDGMQFYQLRRDLDIVLLDARRPFDNGWTFPRGLLREPPSHLIRAGCVVITNADRVSESELEALNGRIERLAPGRPIFRASYCATSLAALDRSCEHSPTWLQGRRVAGFCGLGNPSSFRGQLEQAGAKVVHWTELPDHHEPTMGELNMAIEDACVQGAEAIVVTEKDAVKLPPIMRPIPFFALQVRMILDNDALFYQLLSDRVHLTGHPQETRSP